MHQRISLPEVTSADAFNEMASRNDWPILYDASCQFGHAELSKLLSLWRSMTGRGGIPRRRDMTARLLRPYMRMLSLYERVLADDGARRHRVRLMGSAVVQVLGELTGHFLDEVVPEEFLPRWCPMIDVPLAAGAPMRLLIRQDTFNKSHIVGEYLCVPLRADDGEAKLVLTASCYDGTRTWAEVATEARRRLGLEPAGIV
ncbi:MAG: PAS domain-containing protein [Rhizomicrobium sp.]